MIERYATLGGVCLNVGCIPSKALLHTAKVLDDAAFMAPHGIDFGKPKIDLDKVRGWKDSVVKKLTGGLSMLAKQRNVEVVQGEGKFTGSHEITVETKDGAQKIQFENAIIAAGSQPVKLPFMPEDPRIIDSAGALELKETGGGTVTILSVGGADYEPVIRKALAIGADEAVRIDAAESDSLFVAKQIAAAPAAPPG